MLTSHALSDNKEEFPPTLQKPLTSTSTLPKSSDDTSSVQEQEKVLLAAAEKGDAAAQFNLGLHYYQNKDKRNPAKAAFWFRKAADQGYADAQNNLGMLYETSHGVDADAAQKIYWFRKAAIQGHAKAQNNLGWCYETGAGVKKNLNVALYWFQQAAEQNHPEAEEAFSRLTLQGVAAATKRQAESLPINVQDSEISTPVLPTTPKTTSHLSELEKNLLTKAESGN